MTHDTITTREELRKAYHSGRIDRTTVKELLPRIICGEIHSIIRDYVTRLNPKDEIKEDWINASNNLHFNRHNCVSIPFTST